jgi:hypothetical protein
MCLRQHWIFLSIFFASADRNDSSILAYPKGGGGSPAGWGPAKELTKDEATHELHFQALAPSGALQIG